MNTGASAILLKSVDYSDAHRVVTLFTREHGKLTALARGARQSRRRLNGVLEPFVVSRVELQSLHKEIATLVQGAVTHCFPKVLMNLEKLMLLGGCIERLRRFLPSHCAEPQVFDELVSLFQEMEDRDSGYQEASIQFSVRMLAHLGFAPNLMACGKCSKSPRENQVGWFDSQRGTLVCQRCGGGDVLLHGSTRGHLQQALEAHSPQARLAPWQNECIEESWAMIQALSASQLGSFRKGSGYGAEGSTMSVDRSYIR